MKKDDSKKKSVSGVKKNAGKKTTALAVKSSTRSVAKGGSSSKADPKIT
ncbi:MAG: hypothetical protein QM668_11285 [Agriterribacter sp.]